MLFRSAQERGDQSRQSVVVAEARPQLLDAHGVVFVDDRNRAVVEQGAERIADVEIPGPVLEIIRHQQYLGHVTAVAAEGPFVGLDQAALPDGGDSLELRELVGPRPQPHAAHAGADGSRADEDDLPAPGHEPVELPTQRLDAGCVQEPIGPREHPGPHLHDDRARSGGDRKAQGIGLGLVHASDGTVYSSERPSSRFPTTFPRARPVSDLHHECGLAAIYHLPGADPSPLCPVQGPEEVSRLVPRMLLDIQNRGQLSAGMTVWNPDRSQLLATLKDVGSVSEVFRMSHRGKYESLMEQHAGRAAIGHVRYATCGAEDRGYAQPLERPHIQKRKWFSFGFNGQLAN